MRTSIVLIFAVVSRSASDLPICGILFVDRCLDSIDLELGSSGGAMNDSEDRCRAWSHVPAWICSIFAWFCRSMNDLSFSSIGSLNG